MNAYTTTTESLRPQTESKFARMARNFIVELRRAIEVLGAAHNNGIRPH